ncbi:MAG: flagellar basal-body MS-ring/collar protein FliF [Woeseiaceae bacterium]|nr:flagellar basal-body MS-ring/collar protein FliF [Woeseiaceae bacterium]
MDNANVIEGSATVVPANNMSLATVLRIPAVRQVMLLIGVAAAVAVGFAIVLWSQTPGYTQLYGNVSPAESAEITDALRAADIEFKVNPTTGAILVPESSLATARMQLAAGGYSPSLDTGMSRAFDDNRFGDPNFVLDVRYQAALEAELSQTISSLGAVRDARVHLAIPKETTFLRDNREASASVLVHLNRGRTLEDDQATAIVNLVAASVANLKPGNVTVVDQYGQMLSSSTGQSVGAQASQQFTYARRLEETYKRRVEDLLTSIVGPGRVRAEVSADVDFTQVEAVSESFDPQGVVRSEFTNENLQTGDGYASGGVPGALTNQPPQAAGAAEDQTVVGEDTEIQNSSRSTTRNYEMGRTITSTRPGSGLVRRLNVAVLIDTTPPPVAEGEPAPAAQALSQDVIDRYTTLVQEAIGFDAARGDRVVVIGEAFLPIEAAEPMEEPAIWEQPFVRDLLKQFLGAAIVLAIAFGVLRPMLRGVVASSPPQAISGEFLGSEQGYAMPAAAVAGGEAAALAAPSFEEKVAAAKNMTGHDPARVAQVVKKWVAADE